MSSHSKPFSKVVILTAGLALLLFASSCNRNVLFTKNSAITVSATAPVTSDGKNAKILAPDDKILISVWDHEELSTGSLQGTYSLAEEYGKWLMIDANGEVKLPQVGTVKISDMTVKEATAHLEKIYSKYIQNPVITIRVLNNQVTVLGEVRSPGIYIFSADHVRLIDIIGRAQGLTDFARPQKVKVVRGTETLDADLTNTASVDAKELHIIPGDVIYIPPTKGKSWDRFSTRLIPVASLITAIALIYSVTQK